MPIQVRSRVGNAVLGVIGIVYVCAAAVLLVYELVETWRATSLTDYAIVVVLVGSIAVGLVLAITAARNLGLHRPRHESPPHREAAAIAR